MLYFEFLCSQALLVHHLLYIVFFLSIFVWSPERKMMLLEEQSKLFGGSCEESSASKGSGEVASLLLWFVDIEANGLNGFLCMVVKFLSMGPVLYLLVL